MEKRLIFLTFLVLIINDNLSASAPIGVQFRQATQDDVSGIIELMNTHADKDNDKIVILPKRFRVGAIQAAVKKERFFVASFQDNATTTPSIVGFKKLFCVTDDIELDDILRHELRCIEQDPAASGSVSIAQGAIGGITPSSDTIQKTFSSNTTYIYNGADFTHPDHRNKGICAFMTACALKQAQAKTVENIVQKKSSNIAMAYGLTESNAGNDFFGGRTPGIVKQFIPFVQKVAQELKCTAPSTLSLSSYHAFMPTFNPESSECEPLPDAQSIPGYGYVLACSLEKPIKLAD